MRFTRTACFAIASKSSPPSKAGPNPAAPPPVAKANTNANPSPTVRCRLWSCRRRCWGHAAFQRRGQLSGLDILIGNHCFCLEQVLTAFSSPFLEVHGLNNPKFAMYDPRVFCCPYDASEPQRLATLHHIKLLENKKPLATVVLECKADFPGGLTTLLSLSKVAISPTDPGVVYIQLPNGEGIFFF
jgi:hypothetical protein